jgi:hypothetical protein
MEDNQMPAGRFGKHPAKRDYRTLRFHDYLTHPMLVPPAAVSILERVENRLHGTDPKTLFPMDGNDTLSDCTIAAVAHGDTVFHGLIGRQSIMTKSYVVKLYYHLTGGVDSGLYLLDVVNYWRQNPIARDEILAFASVDVKKHVDVKLGIELFGGVILGFQVQQNCVQEFNAGQPWTPGPLTNEGHAVYAVAYDADGLTVLTWGSTQKATWDWWDECVDEAYALLPPEAQIGEFTPHFNFAQLKADLSAVAS